MKFSGRTASGPSNIFKENIYDSDGGCTCTVVAKAVISLTAVRYTSAKHPGPEHCKFVGFLLRKLHNADTVRSILMDYTHVL